MKEVPCFARGIALNIDKFFNLKKSQIMQKDIVDTADGTTLRRVKTPLWKCTMVEVNFFKKCLHMES